MSSDVICVCFDEKYKDKAESLFVSCIEKGKWKGDFLFIISFYDKEYFAELEKKGIYYLYVDYTEYNRILCNNTMNKEWNYTIMLRMFLFFLDGIKKWDNVLYLDSDIVCLNEIELEEPRWMSAVPEYRRIDQKNVIIKTDFKKNIDYNIEKHFARILSEPKMNSGILYFPTKIWNEQMRKRLLGIIDNYIHYLKNPDQGILNIMFFEDWIKLDDHYGTKRYYFEKNIKEIRNMVFYHCYGGDIKIWEEKSPYYYQWKTSYDKFKNYRICGDKKDIIKFGENISKELLSYKDKVIYKFKTINKIDINCMFEVVKMSEK